MAPNNLVWYKKVLGDELIQCKALTNDNLTGNEKNLVPVDVMFENIMKQHGDDCKLVIGLYFTPTEGVPDECTNYLVQLYHLINFNSDKSPNSNHYEDIQVKQCKKLLEVIQVFLTNSVHWLDRCTVDEGKVLGQLKDLPWYAVSVRDRDRVVSLLLENETMASISFKQIL